MRIWQDGAGPHSGRHPSHFKHIMGPGADEAAEEAALDFWSFAWAWGLESAGASNMMMTELPQLLEVRWCWLKPVEPCSDLGSSA